MSKAYLYFKWVIATIGSCPKRRRATSESFYKRLQAHTYCCPLLQCYRATDVSMAAVFQGLKVLPFTAKKCIEMLHFVKK